MEASRLVFVSVKNAKPRRKVAVPIPDAYTWEQFCQQIQTKLKLKGVGNIYLASSGEKITNLDELQDIDELHAEEAVSAPPSAAPHANGFGPDRTASGSKASPSGNHSSHPSEATSPVPRGQQRQHISPVDTSQEQSPDIDQKYARRSGRVRRSLQRVLPSLFAPTLPVTTRDAHEESRSDGRPRRRRRRDSFFAPRNLLRLFTLLVFLLVLLFLYSRMVPTLE